MKWITGAGLAVTLLWTQLATPPAALAASADRAYQLRTRIVEDAPSVGEFDGSLQLRISPQGIVTGYYRPDDNMRFVLVTGGVKGDRFWLDIGSLSSHPVRFDGTFRNGKIDAQSNEPFLDDGQYTGLELIGTPASS